MQLLNNSDVSFLFFFYFMIMPIITEAANSCSHRLFLASLRPSLGRSNKENLDLYKLLCSSTALIAMENDVFSLVSSKFTGAADL